MSSLSLSEAELIGVTLQSALFGLYVALYAGCIYVLFHRLGASCNGQKINKTLTVITGVLFLLISSNWIISIIRIFRAFTYYVKQDGGPDTYLSNAADPLYVIKSAFYIFQSLVGDITMVYRLYIVWGRSWRIILVPVITTITLFASGLAVIYLLATLPPGTNVFTSKVSGWVITLFITSLATNLVVTSLITFRIWSINRRIQYAFRSNLMPIAVMIIESAALYTIFLILTTGLYVVRTTVQFIPFDVTSPIIGIAFSLLIIRAGLGHKITAESLSTRTRNPVQGMIHRCSNIDATSAQVPIEVNVLTEVDHGYACSASIDEGITGKHPS